MAKYRFKKELIKILKGFYNIISKMPSLLRNIKIQSRLIGSFLILSLIPLTIIGVFSYSKSSDAIKTKISTYSVQVMSQLSKNIQREIASLESDSIDIEFSNEVQTSVVNFDQMSDREIYNIERQLNDALVKRFSFLRNVTDVAVYTNDKKRLTAYGDVGYKLSLEPVYLEKLLKTASAKKGIPVWTAISAAQEIHYVEYENKLVNGRRDGILLCRSIPSLTVGGQIGYIIIRTSEKIFSDIYRDIDIGAGADIFVINSEGLVISSRNPQIEVAKQYHDPSLLQEVKWNKSLDIQTFKYFFDKKNYLTTFYPVEGTDWYVVSTIPFSYLNAESDKIGIYTVVIVIACLFLAVLMSLLISASISKPLKKLIRYMNEVKNGDLSVFIADQSRDEIAEVAGNYNNMLAEIRMLMNNVKSNEKQKRITEFKALQAQINPHFLSNTLNNVRWLANIQKADNIEKLVASLIQLLHVSMGKGDTLITIREEIEYLNSYITIQEYRYCDKFKVYFDIQEEVLDYRILKFLLQPVVENSLVHGIEPMDGQGLIVVKAYCDSLNLMITVTDNGVGISEEVINCLLKEDNQERKSHFSGIGVSNVEERIKLFFGEEYGLIIESIPGLYTKVEIKMPVLKENGE